MYYRVSNSYYVSKMGCKTYHVDYKDCIIDHINESIRITCRCALWFSVICVLYNCLYVVCSMFISAICHVTWSKQVCLLLFSVHSSGRPLPPSTASSSLLPPAPAPPPPAPLHSAPPTIRECQVPLLDSSSSHTMLEPHPEDQISPNSYLLRAQPPTGKPLPLISHWLTPTSLS